MKDTTCKNCGYDKGLHHYQTMQCPVGGEAPIGRKQEWMTLTYKEPDHRDEIIAAQAARIAELEEALDNAQVTIHLIAHKNGKAYIGCPDCEDVRKLVTKWK